MKRFKVSVIIPVYNKELYILDCLKSVRFQTFRDWECILVDDGSTDGSLSIIQTFIDQCPGDWTVICKTNEGPSATRNRGILHAKGEYLAFLDSDDIWFPEKLAKQVEFMESHRDVDLLLTNYIIFDTGEVNNLRSVRLPSIDKLLSRWLDMRGFGGLVESTGMLRSSRIRSGLLFDPTLRTTEGLDLVFNWHRRGRVTALNEFLTLYRISPDQLHKKEDLIRQNALLIAGRYPDSFSQTRLNQDFQRAYFYLSKQRKRKKLQILGAMLFSLFHLDVRVFQMAFWLIARNIRAKTLPFHTRKLVRTILGG